MGKSKLPDEKVIKTLSYNVKSSRNQSERGLSETAILSACECPKEPDIVQRDIYVDDCLSGEKKNINKALERVDQLELLLYISVTMIPLN